MNRSQFIRRKKKFEGERLLQNIFRDERFFNEWMKNTRTRKRNEKSGRNEIFFEISAPLGRQTWIFDDVRYFVLRLSPSTSANWPNIAKLTRTDEPRCTTITRSAPSLLPSRNTREKLNFEQGSSKGRVSASSILRVPLTVPRECAVQGG